MNYLLINIAIPGISGLSIWVHPISGRGAGNYGAGSLKPGRLQNRDTRQKPNVRHYAPNRLNHGQMVVVASIRSIQTFYASIDKNNHQ